MSASTGGLMFPGQGTQTIGMGRWMDRSSAAASEVFDLASDLLARDVRALCFTGPPRELTQTRNAQVAVFTCNAAAAALLSADGFRAQLAIGHSVGELNALVAAGVMSLADGLRLVAARGELMGQVTTPGAMTAIIGLDPETVRRLCTVASGTAAVVPALVNGPANVVVSGAVDGVSRCERLAHEAGARKVTRLVVSSAFHSPLMAGAVGAWCEVVAAAPLRDPVIPVVLNATGTVASDVAAIRQALVDQLTGPVRWVEGIRTASAAGVRLLVEAGDCKVLSGLTRAIDPGLRTVSLRDPRALRRLREGATPSVARPPSRVTA